MFDCASCMENGDELQRRLQHCGWMDASEWLNPIELPETIGESGVQVRELGICPGWLVRQPAVAETVDAFAAMELGELRTFCPRPDNALVDGLKILGRARARFIAEQRKRPPKTTP